MKRFLIIFFTLFYTLTTVAQQATIKGKVQNTTDNATIAAVKIDNGESLFTTDNKGNFSFNLPEGNYTLNFSKSGYESKIIEVTLKAGDIKDLGIIKLNLIAENNEAAVISLSDADLENEDESANISQILHGSRDPFLSAAGYNLGSFRFRVRGYGSEYSSVYINGLNFNNPENDRAYWFLWGGLNDVTRNKITTNALDASDYAINSIGGGTNILTTAKDNSPGFRFTYSSSNRSYRNRAMITYSSGETPKGWAFTLSSSRRWSQEGYVEATLYDAYAYFASIDKKINASNYINFTTFASPSTRGKQGASLQEMYDLMGNNFYNPYWGYQNDYKRNSRISKSNQPVFNLNYQYKPSDKFSLKLALGYSFGYNNSTSLNWYNARDPRPDYYRYLPSYMNSELAKKIRTEQIQNNPAYSQINWARLYEVNRNSSETINNADGIEGNTISGLQSQYIVEDRHNDQKISYANILLKKEINKSLKLSSGAYFRKYKGTHYKTMDDLLGGEFWVDVDKYAERDFGGGDAAQNDLLHPNRLIKKDDLFGYKYDANINYSELWAQANYAITHWEINTAIKVSNTQFWRTGYMQNGKFPNNSLGNSQKYSFTNYNAKIGITYKLNGRNYFSINAASLTKAPNFMNSFISPRTRNSAVDKLSNENIVSTDINYILRSPVVKARLSAYYTQFSNQIWTRSFYHEGYRNFVNYSMTGIAKTNTGIELGSEIKLSSSLQATFAAAYGIYTWNTNPKVKITIDNSEQILANNEIVYIQGYKVAGTPQTAASIGLRYNGLKYWFAGINANYTQNNYLSINPTRRTLSAVKGTDDATKATILAQEKLAPAYTLDLFAGKSFKFHQYYLRINLSINNILNNQNFITGGYEQLRYDETTHDINKFPPKYYYMYGTTYFLNISINF